MRFHDNLPVKLLTMYSHFLTLDKTIPMPRVHLQYIQYLMEDSDIKKCMLKPYTCMFEHTLLRFGFRIKGKKVGGYEEGVEMGRENSTRVPWFSLDANMHRKKVICLALVMGIGLLLVGSASALPSSHVNQEPSIGARGGLLRERFPVEQYGFSRKKPKFPPPEERKKIKKRQRVLERYPQISITGGLSLISQGNAGLNETFGRLESGYGFRSGDEFSGSCFSSTFGMRLYVTRQISFSTEYAPGGNGVTNIFSVSGLYSVYQKDDISVSIGIGRTIQRLQAERDYSYRLDYDSYWGNLPVTLETIRIDTGEQNGWLVSAVLDVWGQVIGQTTGFFLAVNYIEAPTVSETIYLPYQTETVEEPKLEVSMSGWSISGGLTFTFQI